MNLKKFVSFVCILILPLVFPNVVDATYYYNEEFDDGWTNIAKWDIFPNGGNLNFSSDYLELTSNNPDGFPYIASSEEVFPDGDFSIEWRFRYLNQNYGTGISITDVLPVNRTSVHPNRDVLILGNWVAVPEKIVLSYALCEESDPDCASFPSFISDGSDFYQFNTVRVDYVDGQYSVYYNEELKFKSAPTDRVAKHIWFGNPLDPVTALDWSEFQLDYIRITDLSNNHLEVPLMLQNDPLWADDEYDHAFSWGAEYPYMKNLACAVTSAAMQLVHKEVYKLPDGTLITPKTLDEYLKNVDEGYMGKGWTNWEAIAGMTKLASDSFKGTPKPPKLEWQDVKNRSFGTYEQHIDEDQSEILKLSGYWGGSDHFFVGTGYDDNNILINDPLGRYAELSRGLAIERRGYFYKTNSDFSAMVFASADNVDLLLIAPDGSKVGRQDGVEFSELNNNSYLIEQVPFFTESDAEVSFPTNTVLKTKHLLVGEYKLVISATQSASFAVDTFVQNVDASAPVIPDITGNLDAGEYITYIVNFANDSENSVVEYATFGSIRQFIEDEYAAGNIDSKWLKNHLLLKLRVAELMNTLGRHSEAKMMLQFMLKELVRNKDKLAQETVAELMEMISELVTKLE
jgi:hypothetical protein